MLDQITKAFSCYLVMEHVLPNNIPDNTLTAKIRGIYTSKEDDLHIKLYVRCLILLISISSLCATLHSVQHVLYTTTHGKFLVNLYIFIFGYSINYYRDSISLTVSVQEILKATSYICICYSISSLQVLDKHISFLILFHLKTLYFPEISLYVFFITVVVIIYLVRYYDIGTYVSALQTVLEQLQTKITNHDKLLRDLAFLFTSYAIVITFFIALEWTDMKCYNLFDFPQSLIAIMCTTILGTLAYITLVVCMCFLFFRVVMLVLMGRRYNSSLKKNILELSIFPSLLTIQSLNESVAIHGRLMYCSLVFVGVHFLEIIYFNFEPNETDVLYGRKLQCGKTVIIYLFLALIPPFASLVVLSTWPHQLDILWPRVIAVSWISNTISIFGSFLSFCLLICDNIRRAPIDKLDDYVDYISFATDASQIWIGIFGMAVLLWETVAVKWVWLNPVIIGLSLFSTLDTTSKKWNEFKQRRVAIQCLSLLPNATKVQIEQYNDDCAICLRSIISAKVTPCNHLFHERCLKTWTHEKKTCPMCNNNIENKIIK